LKKEITVMTQADSAPKADLNLVDHLVSSMQYLAPDVPFKTATQLLEKASLTRSNIDLYAVAYLIVIGQVEP